MRIATFILSLFLVVPMTIQSCAISLLPGQDSGPGAVGLLTAMLTVIALAFVLPYPLIASVFYLCAAFFAFLGSSIGFGDLVFYSFALLIFAVMAFIGWLGKPRDKGVKQAAAAPAPASLAGTSLEWTNPQGTNLAEVTQENLYDLLNRTGPLQLVGIDLSGINLAGANLAEANLRQANLAGTNLTGANLAGANLTQANLAGAYLTQANLAGAFLKGATLAGAQLSGADLERADLEGANLERANLRRAKLTGAKLQGVNLKGTDLTFADMRKTDRREVIFDNATVWPEFFEPSKKHR